VRLFKQQRKISFNWKYILGELLLIFLGITLAIWFNNWNAANKVRKEKGQAIIRIKQEIQDNLKQITAARVHNQPVQQALRDYFGKEEMALRPAQMRELQRKHPGFATITDSTAAKDEMYHYSIETKIGLELPELTEIAWETAQTIGVAREFGYDCLYELEKTYRLQDAYQQEMDKVVGALQDKRMSRLLVILDFSTQFNDTLEDYYRSALETIDNCR
jgi:hypothetical protein